MKDVEDLRRRMARVQSARDVALDRKRTASARVAELEAACRERYGCAPDELLARIEKDKEAVEGAAERLYREVEAMEKAAGIP